MSHFLRRAAGRWAVTMVWAILLSFMVSVVSAVSTVSAQPPAVDRASLRPIPAVALDVAEPAVRQQLEQQRAELERILQRNDLAAEILAQAYGETGQLYLVYDLTSAAEACLMNAVMLAPSVERWHYLLGTLYQLDNRLELAATSLQETLRLAPGDGAAVMRLAEIALRQERADEAQGLLARAVGSPGFEAAARFGLGRLAAKRGDARAAVEQFARALELQPGADVLHYHLGQGYRDLGDEEAMRREFAVRGENPVRFPDPLALELQARATGVGALLALGRLSLTVGLVDEAVERFRRAVAVDPESAAARRSLAGALHRQGKVEDALIEYEKAVRGAPDDAGLRYFVAKLELDRVRVGEVTDEAARASIERAVDHLRAVLEQAPDFLAALVELAGAQELLGDAAGAAESLERALALDPGAAALRVYRARMLLAAGDPAGARTELGRVDGLGEIADKDVLDSALLRFDLGDLEKARPSLRFLSERAAEPAIRARALFHLGNLDGQEGAFDQAIGAYRKALEIDERLVEARFNLGTLLGRRGDFRGAAIENRRAIDLEPGYHQARYAEAMAWILAGELATAKKRLEEGLEAYPNHPGFAHLLARLLVAAADPAIRDGMTGLEIAVRLYQAVPSGDHAETVAMGFAEIGRFDRAVEWQELLVQTLEKGDDAAFLARAKHYLELYRKQQPVRSPWAD